MKMKLTFMLNSFLLVYHDVTYGVARDCNVNNGQCEYQCITLNDGSARCECGLLGELQANGESCFYKPKIYFGNNQEIVFVYNQTYFVSMDNFQQPRIIALSNDYVRKKIFYASTAGPTTSMIGVIDLKFRTQRNLRDVHGVIGDIVHDDTTGSLYFTLDDGNVGVLKDLPHKNISSYSIAKLSRPNGIAIDACLNFVFVTDIEIGEIIRINTRKDTKISIIKDLYYPRALTLDKVSEKIFWTDVNKYNFGRIEISNYDGSCRRSVMENKRDTQPFSIIYVDAMLYWTDVENYKIFLTKVLSGMTHVYQQLPGRALTIDYFGLTNNKGIGIWSSWTTIHSCLDDCYNTSIRMRRCQTIKESFSCSKRQCIERLKCKNEDGLFVSEDQEIINTCNPMSPCKDAQDDDKTSPFPIIVGGAIGGVVLLLIIAVCIYVFYRRRNVREEKRRSENSVFTVAAMFHKNSQKERDIGYDVYMEKKDEPTYEEIPDVLVNAHNKQTNSNTLKELTKNSKGRNPQIP